MKTKKSIIGRSLAFMLAFAMVLTSGNISALADETLNEENSGGAELSLEAEKSIEDGVTYTVPITVGYDFDGYESYASSRSGMLSSTAEIKADGDYLTVTLFQGAAYENEYLTGLKYKDNRSDTEYKDADIVTDENGNMTQATFTIPYTENYIGIALVYPSLTSGAIYNVALGIDFANVKEKTSGGDTEEPQDPDADVTFTHTAYLDTNWSGKITDGSTVTYLNAEDVVKLPELPDGADTTSGFFETSVVTSEVGLVENNGNYTLILQTGKQGFGGFELKELHLVHVDLNDIDAQTSEQLTPAEVTVDGTDMYQYQIDLGTEEHLSDPIFMWAIYTGEFAGANLTYYTPIAVSVNSDYLIDLSEEQMVEDGNYTASVDYINEVSGSKYSSYLQSRTDIPVVVKDGEASIYLKLDNNFGKKGSSYAVYGSDTNYLANAAQMIPVSGEAANTVILKTKDLRRVLFLCQGSSASIDGNGINLKLTDLNKADAAVSYEFLDDGNYTAEVELSNAEGISNSALTKYFETANVPIQSKDGKVTVSLRMTKEGLESFKQSLYGSYSNLTTTPISGTALNMVDFTLYYIEDTAFLKAELDGKEITFQAKLKEDSVKKIESASLLKDGNYTVDITCLKDGSNDVSMSGSYFDKESVPVTVKDGKIYMDISIKTSSDDGTMKNLVKGLKHKLGSNWIDDNPQELENTEDGIPRVGATIEVQSLEDPTYVQIYVTAMGWWATLRIVPDLGTLKGEGIEDMLDVPKITTDPSNYTGMFGNDKTISVSMTTSEKNADIYYTVDGSTPVVGGAKTFKYNGAININSQSEEANTVTIKAISYKDGEKSFAKSYDVNFLAKETEIVVSKTEPGVYSVPYRIRKAFENDYSMADDAVDGNMIVQVYKDEEGNLKSNYYMTVKARNQNNIIGHLLQLWNIEGTDAPTGAPADYELDSEKANVLTTVNEDGLSGTADYPRLLQFSRNSAGEEYFYIRVDVDAMGDTHQSAKIVMDWENATAATLPDGEYSVPYAVYKAFENDYSMANDVVDGPASVTINNGNATYSLPVKARNQNNIIGHLLRLWNIEGTDAPTGAPADYELDSQLAAVTKTVNEVGIDGTEAEYGSEFTFTRNSTGENAFYVRVDVDAMGEDHQSAKLALDWSNAVWVGEAKEQVETPVLTEEGNFEDSKEISIACDTKGAVIYYTTDGSTPSASNGQEYKKAFTVTDTTNVKAVAVKENMKDSLIASATYTKTESKKDDGTDDKIDVSKAGRYLMDVQLWNAYADQASMGNVAFKDVQDLLISDGNGHYTLRVATVPVSVAGFTTAITEMEQADGKTVDIIKKADYTTNTTYDGSAHDLTFIQEFAVDVEEGQEYVSMKMKVPYTPMDAVGASTDGWLYCRLKIDWDSAVKVADDYELKHDTYNKDDDNNDDNDGLDINNLADGVYSITGNMVKIDKTTASMSDNAINHTIKLTVKDGKYYITLNFNGLTIGQKLGYLSQLKYFTTGYTLDEYGNPQGNISDVVVDSYQKNEDGSLVSDTYGTNYPDEVTFELIPEALKDGYVPLQVFVPIMDAISEGSGTQPVFLKLDWSTIKVTTDDDPSFDNNDNGNNGSDGSNGTTGNIPNSTLNNKGTTTTGSKLSGSSLKNASSVKTGDMQQDVTVYIAIILLGGALMLAGVMNHKRKNK